MQWSVPNGSVGAVPRAWKVQRALRCVSKLTPLRQELWGVRGVGLKTKDGIF